LACEEPLLGVERSVSSAWRSNRRSGGFGQPDPTRPVWMASRRRWPPRSVGRSARRDWACPRTLT